MPIDQMTSPSDQLEALQIDDAATDGNPFDEDYYQNGSLRGTQYNDYLQTAPGNRLYFEIAEAIYEVFKPARTLEIGCAPGIIVSNLATFDVEPHGIDISKWAVENRFHENVMLGSADNLPFEDDYFDVVYSVHALEHLPKKTAPKAFQEISRVCRGAQLHLIPMLESGPYVGDRIGHLVNLRSDPTHNLLFDKEWWRSRFERLGWTDSRLQIGFTQDNEHFELSDCQIILTRDGQDNYADQIAQWNFRRFRLLSDALNGKASCGLQGHVARLMERAR